MLTSRPRNEPRPLIERDRVLDHVCAAFEEAVLGAGQTVIVSGPPGIGKTSVLEAAAPLARAAELRVLRARGSETEQGFPFAGALQLLETTVRALGDGADSLLGGAAALARPVLDGAYLSGAGGPLPAAVHGLFWLTVNLAQRQPLALLIDDLQAIDDPTLAYLLYLHRRIGDLPIAVLAATRPVEQLTRQAIPELVFDPGAAELPLPALSKDGVTALVRAEFDPDADDEFCEACARISAGNPFYLWEALETLRLEGAGGDRAAAERLSDIEPQAIVRSVLLRLARLDSTAQMLARACAILGPDVPVSVAAGVAQLPARTALDAADALAGTLILEPGHPLRIAHPLIGAALENDLGAGMRAELHQRAAEVLSREHAPAERIAAHLLHAPPSASEQHVDVLAAAAAHAQQAGSPAAATAYLRRALAEPPATQERRVQLLLALGRAEIGTNPDDAAAHLEQARSLGADERSAGQLALELGRALYVAGNHERAALTFLAAADRLSSNDPIGRELQAWFASASVLVGALRPRARELVAQLTLEPPARPTAGERAVLARSALERITLGGPLREVRRLADIAWGDGALLREETSDGYSWMHVTAIHLWGGDYSGAERIADLVIEDARGRGSVMAFATASYVKAWAELFQGRLPDAMADIEQTLEVHRRDGWTMFIAAARYIEAEILLERGRIEDAAAAVAAIAPERFSASAEGAVLRYARGRVALALDRPDEAIAELRAAREQAWRLDLRPVRLLPVWLPMAQALARLGRPEEALSELADGERAARTAELPEMTAAMLVAKAGLLDEQPALETLRDAVSLAGRSQSKLELARALAALGVRLRRAGRRADAEPRLRTALELAHRAGAAPLEALVREELAVLGARPRRAVASGVESLTASELRVARLAAGGLTNRAIAEALFVTPKTVEYHLRNVYMKLSISSRTELGHALAEDA